jgi:hypothetical protein
MHPPGPHPARKLVEYDALRRRLWILGQRCHHGATGSVVAALACIGLIAIDRDPRSPLVAVVATGGVLMAHDWKDHSMWFQRGRGAQP